MLHALTRYTTFAAIYNIEKTDHMMGTLDTVSQWSGMRTYDQMIDMGSFNIQTINKKGIFKFSKRIFFLLNANFSVFGI
jgi:hypothetical protein